MDIPALSMALSASQVHTDIGTAMLSKSLDLVETMGEGMQKIMESSVTPHLGQNINVSI